MSKNSSSSSGIGIAGVLTIVFIVLKLVGVGPVANWSWWWVLSPMWISTGIVIFFLLVMLLISLVRK